MFNMVNKTVDIDTELLYLIIKKMEMNHISSYSFVVRELLVMWVNDEVKLSIEN